MYYYDLQLCVLLHYYTYCLDSIEAEVWFQHYWGWFRSYEHFSTGRKTVRCKMLRAAW